VSQVETRDWQFRHQLNIMHVSMLATRRQVIVAKSAGYSISDGESDLPFTLNCHAGLSPPDRDSQRGDTVEPGGVHFPARFVRGLLGKHKHAHCWRYCSKASMCKPVKGICSLCEDRISHALHCLPLSSLHICMHCLHKLCSDRDSVMAFKDVLQLTL